tara:strand:- start:2675 stop:3064 length:390 start_codon:yes stop_codon:yes gene_type:complete
MKKDRVGLWNLLRDIFDIPMLPVISSSDGCKEIIILRLFSIMKISDRNVVNYEILVYGGDHIDLETVSRCPEAVNEIKQYYELMVIKSNEDMARSEKERNTKLNAEKDKINNENNRKLCLLNEFMGIGK